MKQTIKSILAIAMILCMLFTVVGCGGSGEVGSDEQVAADDSFFTDEATQNEKEETESKDTTSADKDTSSGSGGNTTTIVPNANKVGGKSWKDVLASMPKKLRGKTITIANWNTANEYTGAPEVIEKFTKQTGINVKWQNITYANYFTKITALVASGKGIPDIARLRIDVFTMLKDLQPLSVTGYDFSDEAWDQDIMKVYTYGDNTYATSLKNTHLGSPIMLLYNKGLIEKHDMEDPYQLWKAGKWTWNKYIEMCREFKELSPNTQATSGDGFFEVYATCFGYAGTIGYNGKQFYNPMKEDKFLEVYQMLGDFYNKEKLFDFGGQDRMNSQGALFSIATAIHLRRKNSYFGNIKSANNLYAVPMPTIEGQGIYYQGFREVEAYGIPKGAPTPEAVPYFLRFFLDGANYTLANYFCNEQNLEVYNWCMNQPNIVVSYGQVAAIGGVGENSIMTKTGAQMKTFIDSNYGTVDKTIKEYNDIVATLK